VSWSSAVDNDPGDTVTYLVEWSLNGRFPAWTETTTDTTLTIKYALTAEPLVHARTAGLPDRSTITWRVTARDTKDFVRTSAQGDSGWSFSISLYQPPTEFRLQPIFPNPFNSRVAVTVDVAVEGDVEVAFYNLLGQKVFVQQGVLKPGSHRVFFPPATMSDLAAGIYWVRVRQGEESEIAKLVLVR
jgi:hypothetical protein